MAQFSNHVVRLWLVAITFSLVGSIGNAAEANKPIDVWFDVDTATGSGDVDDGLMLIQAFHSTEINIRGISVVFGNAPLDKAVPIARTITSKFGPAGVDPKVGAAGADDLGKRTEAVEAIAAQLKRAPMTIAAVGPVTNIGTLVKLYPELHDRIDRIVMVAARRPNQRFVTNDKQKLPHQDFNFELDPVAMQEILDTNVPLVFAPWEVSSHVWISRDDLKTLQGTGGSGAWIAETSPYWIERWETNGETRGFNPFDTLAVGWLTHPRSIKSMEVSVTIEEDADDRADPQSGEVKTKPYLVVRPYQGSGRQAIYCFDVRPNFKPTLMKRLSGR